MLTDIELLGRYAKAGSESDFGVLVSRHVDLVYGTALRLVGGDAHLAADVAQGVFTDLARKADGLSARRQEEGGDGCPTSLSLSGWLYTSTRFAAMKSVRAEQTRRKYEQEAHEMNEILNGNSPGPDWSELRPVLDDAMGMLSASDREAVLLRFFEKRSLAETSAALGCEEDAARKRVHRALEKLRDLLARRGVRSSTAALTVLLGQHGVMAAPAGMAATITSSAVLAGASVTAGTTSTWEILRIMASTKLKSTVYVALLTGLLTPVVMQQRSLSAVRREAETLRQSAQDVPAPIQEPAGKVEPLSEGEREEFAQLRRDHGELLRLRGEVGRRMREAESDKAFYQKVENAAERYQRQVAARQDELNKCTETKLAGGFKLAEASAVGLSTPEATLQSFIAAVVNNDAKALAELQWPDFLPGPFTLEQLTEMCEGRLVALRGGQTEGVSGIRLHSLRRYAEDRVEILYDFECDQPRKVGRPAGGRLLLRHVDGQWLLEYSQDRLPEQLERMRWPAPVIEGQNQ